MKRFFAAVLAALILLAFPGAVSAADTKPRIDHVVVVVLENTTAEDVLVNKRGQAPFLNSLATRGVQLDAMYGVDHNSLPNYLAMVSGHNSKATTRADCFVFSCVYKPGDDDNIGDQLEAKGLNWMAYVDGMETPCQHTPEGRIEKYRSGYATRHNPFLYFASILRNPARCAANDVPLQQLSADVSGGNLPALSFVVPDTCHDGHDCPLSTADAWMESTLTPLLNRPEIKDHGLVVVTFDEADGSDHRGCCGNARGGRIATWVLGAGVPAGVHSPTPYTHYSLLRTIEDTFGLPCLRHACDAQTSAYGPEIWGGQPRTVDASPALARERGTARTVALSLLGLALAAGVVAGVHRRRTRGV